MTYIYERKENYILNVINYLHKQKPSGSVSVQLLPTQTEDYMK